MPFKHVQIYRVIAIAILLFSVVTNSRQGQSDEAVLHKIEAADGTIKVEHIIRYVQSNYRFKTKTSLKLGALALEQLRLNPNTDQASRLRSQLSRAYIYAGDFINAERLANEAQVIAMRNNNIANRILANIVQADIAIRQVNLTQAKDILDTALADALTINHLEHLASVSTLSGKVHKDALQYHISLKHYLNSLDYYTKLSDLAGISVAHQNLASLYRWMGMYDKTLSHQQKALSQALERSDKRALSIIYGNLGTYLKDVKKYQDAIQMHKKSLALKEELKYSFGILQTYNRLGHLYHLIEEYEQSLHYLNLAVTLASKLAIPNKLGSTFLDLGRVHRKMGNFNLAESYLNQSIQLYRGSHVEFRLAEVYLALARLHAKNKTPNKAINDFHHGIDIALRYKREAVLVRLYAGLAKELKLINNYEQALKYTNLQMSSKDLITLRNNQTKVDALLIEFDVAEKQRTIITLTQKNRINTLELENRAFQQKVTVGSLLLASTLLFFLFFLHNKSKKIKIEQTALKQVNDVKERLSLALWGSRDELWDWNLVDGNMVRENKTTTAELPCGQIGSTLEKIKLSIHPDDFKQLEEAFDNHLKGNCEFYEVSYRVLTQAGHWLWVLDRGKVTLRSENGLAQRISGTVKDISVLKASELALSELNNNLEQKVEERTTSLKESRDALATTIDELQTMQSTLIESQKMASIGKLVVGISHELNTPLGISVTAVSLLIEKLQSFQNKFLENQLTRSDTKDFVETSLSSVQLLDSNISRAAQLVKRFKQVSVSEHIQSSRTINLNELINTFLSMHCELEGVTISINCSKDLHAQCDAHALVNVLNELYQNSIQHGFNSPSTGKISIQLEKIGDQIKLTFSDSGKGVHEKNMPHLFEPFFTTTRHNGNAGLGLYLVYSNVTHILRGQISFQTVELEGISFEIYFPVFNDSPN